MSASFAAQSDSPPRGSVVGCLRAGRARPGTCSPWCGRRRSWLVVGGDRRARSSVVPTGAAVLIASYPVHRRARLDRHGTAGWVRQARGLRINAALSSLAVAAIVATAFASDVSAVLVAFGAWAAVSGGIQFARGRTSSPLPGPPAAADRQRRSLDDRRHLLHRSLREGRRPLHDGRRLHGFRGTAVPALSTPYPQCRAGRALANHTHPTHWRTHPMFASRFGRLRTLVALAAVGLASITSVTTARARGVSPKPTVVLVHGAFADSSGWDGVIDRLRHDGYPVRAARIRCSDCGSTPTPSVPSSTASQAPRSWSATPTAAPSSRRPPAGIPKSRHSSTSRRSPRLAVSASTSC